MATVTTAAVNEYNMLQQKKCCCCNNVRDGHKYVAWTMIILGSLGVISAILELARGGGNGVGNLVLAAVVLGGGIAGYRGYSIPSLNNLQCAYRTNYCLTGCYLCVAIATFIGGIILWSTNYKCDEDDDTIAWCDISRVLGAVLVAAAVITALFAAICYHFGKTTYSFYRILLLESHGVDRVANAPATGGVQMVPVTAQRPEMCPICQRQVFGPPGTIVVCGNCGSQVQLSGAAPSTNMAQPPSGHVTVNVGSPKQPSSTPYAQQPPAGAPMYPQQPAGAAMYGQQPAGAPMYGQQPAQGVPMGGGYPAASGYPADGSNPPKNV